jgi:hypothetical protein
MTLKQGVTQKLCGTKISLRIGFWHDLFTGYRLVLLIMAVVSLAHVIHVWTKQRRELVIPPLVFDAPIIG